MIVGCVESNEKENEEAVGWFRGLSTFRYYIQVRPNVGLARYGRPGSPDQNESQHWPCRFSQSQLSCASSGGASRGVRLVAQVAGLYPTQCSSVDRVCAVGRGLSQECTTPRLLSSLSVLISRYRTQINIGPTQFQWELSILGLGTRLVTISNPSLVR